MTKLEKEVERVKLDTQQKRFLFWANLGIFLLSFVIPLMDINGTVGYEYLYRAQVTGYYSLMTLCFLLIVVAWFFILFSFCEKDLTKKYKLSKVSLLVLLVASFVYTVFGFICVRNTGTILTFAPVAILLCLCTIYLFEVFCGKNERLRDLLEKEEVT